jgi:hypothetical protein
MHADLFEFISLVRSSHRSYHQDRYFISSLQRQYRLFSLMSSLAANHKALPRTLLSIGAGGAFVEKAIKMKYGFKVTILDFPEMIERNRDYYVECGFQCFGVDLTGNWPDLPPVGIILSADNIEHVRSSGQVYLQNCRHLTLPAGYLVISTDNFGRTRNLYRLLRGRDISPDLGKVLSSTCFDNEGFHRKEFNWLELRQMIIEAGFQLRNQDFCWQAYHSKGQMLQPQFILEFLVPSLRPHQIICAIASS